MKNRIIYLLAGCLAFSSCSKELDELEPFTDLTSSIALKDAAGVRNAVIGTYGILRNQNFYGADVQMMSDFLGGNLDLKWHGTFSEQKDMLYKQMVSNNLVATQIWNRAYQTINAANNVLPNLDKITDPTAKNTAKGELLFLRAICHFELVRLFGLPWEVGAANDQLGVPIMLTPSNFEKVSRSTVAQVYAQVIADLTEAESILPSGNGVYANKFTAKAYLARIYLQQGNYASALAKANDVIQNSGKSLTATVSAIFNTNNTAESLFEIQQTEANNAGVGNSGLFAFYSNQSQARGDIEILDTHLNLYEATDKRRTDLFYRGTLAPPKNGNWTCGKWRFYNRNYILMRLSEMYLIRAESNQRLASSTGDTPLNDVNRIRQRANATALGSVDLNAITFERRLEFCFEGHRIHDMKRLKENVNSTIPAFSLPYNDAKLVCPIPFSEMTTNPNLVQNPGY